MPRLSIETPEPIKLVGDQAILKPSKFGYHLTTIMPFILQIEDMDWEYFEAIEWAMKKLKYPKQKREAIKPWEVVNGGYKIKFYWNEKNRPTIYDSQNNLLVDENLDIPEGSMAKIAFYIMPFILKDGKTYGARCKLEEIQIVKLAEPCIANTPRFPKTDGWVYS